jgi:GNAT superfamily N-acetyltransferase
MDLAELAVSVLMDDPMFVFIQPDTSARRRLLDWYVPRVIRRTEQRGRVDTIPGQAVAIWIPPGSTLRPPLLSRADLLVVPFRVGFGATQRAMEFAAAVGDAWRGVGGDAWQLVQVSVAPGRRSLGLGAQVLAPALALADAAGQRCHIATYAEATLPFLQSQGFEVHRHLRIEGLPQFWTMVREPRG